MNEKRTIERGQRFISATWRAQMHGAHLTSELYFVMRDGSTREIREEAERLYREVFHVISEIREKCKNCPRGIPHVAFFPVNVIDNETGQVTQAKDTLDYGSAHSEIDRVNIRMAEAVRELEGEDYDTDTPTHGTAPATDATDTPTHGTAPATDTPGAATDAAYAEIRDTTPITTGAASDASYAAATDAKKPTKKGRARK